MLNVMFSSLAIRLYLLIISSHSASSVSAVIKQSVIKIYTRNITTCLVIFLFHRLIKSQIIITNSTLFLGEERYGRICFIWLYMLILPFLLENIIENPIYFSE